jgi:hypothetical protein
METEEVADSAVEEKEAGGGKRLTRPLLHLLYVKGGPDHLIPNHPSNKKSLRL